MMTVRVRIPSPLRKLTGNRAEVDCEGDTIRELLENLENRFPGIKERICDEDGKVRRFVNICVNREDMRSLEGEDTKIEDGDEVFIIPAFAGASMMNFTEEQIRRYSRHIIMPEVGGKGQTRLLEAKVLLIGAGGLGSPAGFYLAAAGVGTLGIIDFDVVDDSNLQRQILHKTSDIGRPKTQSAKETIISLNPDVQVSTYREKLTSDNIMDIIKDYDIILDGCDNFPTRYLVNDACVMAGKPNVHGSVFRFEGQATLFLPYEGPCYRCLYPSPPPPGLVPSCQEAGVLGVLPGVIGLIQAIETIKLILKIGDSLCGRLLIFDALAMEFSELQLRQDPTCPMCGENREIFELIDYEEFCGIGRGSDRGSEGVRGEPR